MSESFDPYYQWLGIPPEDQPPNHYQLLGIKWFEDNVDVISAAADRQVLHLRTYQIGEYSEFSQRLLSEVISAKICLLDPEKKAVYDQKLLESDLEKTVDIRQGSQQTTFTPQLDALFDEAEHAQAETLIHRHKKKFRKPSWRLVALLVAIIIGLLFVWALISAGNWLFENISSRLNSQIEPAEQADVDLQAVLPKDESVDANAAADDLSSAIAKEKPSDLGDLKQTDEDVRQETEPLAKERTAQERNASGRFVGRPTYSKTKMRFPVPTAGDRRRAAERLEERFHFSAARAPIEKIRLAKQLLRGTRGMGFAADAAALRYEMLDQASKLAADSGNYLMSMAVIDEIAASYDIDSTAAKQARLIEAVAKAEGPRKLQQLCAASDKLIDDALAEQRFDFAQRIIDIALMACKESAGKEFRKSFIERRKDISRQQKQHDNVERAHSKLEKTPNDGPANLFLGLHYCFEQENWQQGLPFLAKGNDDELASLAKIELEKPPQNADEEVAMADAWWKLATTRFGPQKKYLLLRSAYWYRQAQSGLSSGRQTRHVAKRLETIIRLTESEPE